MKGFIIIVGLIALLIFSCDDSSDIFKKNNVSPNLYLHGVNGHTNYLSDSIKLTVNSSYILNFSYDDDQLKPLQIDYKFTSGAGVIEFDNDSTVIIYPLQGDNIIDISVRDCYNQSSTSSISLFAFLNLIPISLFEFSYNNELLIIDATKSYDQDSIFGGKIVEYEYTIGSKVISWHDSYIELTTYVKNLIQLKVRVKDNDGVWSDFNSKFIYL